MMYVECVVSILSKFRWFRFHAIVTPRIKSYRAQMRP